MNLARLTAVSATGLLFLSDLCIAQYNIIPPVLTKEGRDAKQTAAVEKVIESAAKETPGLLMTGRALLINGGDAVKGAVARTELYSLTVDALKVTAGAIDDGRDGFVREAGQFTLDRTAAAVAGAAVESLVESAVVLGGVTSAVAAGTAGISYGVGVVSGSYFREKPVNQYGSIGDAVDRTAFRAAPDVLKELLSGTKQVEINSKEFLAEQDSNYDRLRRENSFNRLLGEHQQATKQQAAYIAAQRAEMDSNYAEQSRSADQRRNNPASSGYASPPSGGFDPSAVTNSLKQISADLQARQNQQILLQQQRQQFSVPPSYNPQAAPSTSGRSSTPSSSGSPLKLPACTYSQTPC